MPALTHAITLTPEMSLHFVGAGGIGMSGLAKVLLQAGFSVSGSDVREHENLEPLRTLGATITVGHAAQNVPEGAVVVCSTAINPTNPEVAIAQQRHQPIVHRSDILKNLLSSPAFPHSVTIGITGSHGKTSTTGLVACALHGALGAQPTAIAGGLFPQCFASPLTNAVLGLQTGIAVAELDESDGTLTQYQPEMTVLLNLEMDHAEHFPGGLEELTANIQTFVAGLAGNAPKVLLVNAACAQTMAVVANAPDNVTVLTFDWWNANTTADYTLVDVDEHQPARYQGTVMHTPTQTVVATLAMQAPGKHQLGNGAVAAVVGHILATKQPGFTVPEAIEKKLLGNSQALAQGINAFTGMGRRFEVVGNANGALLVDDYAHHPTEIAAMLKVGRDYVKGVGKLYAIFEPHRYSRLQMFWNEFQESLLGADEVWVTPVYAASEPEREGICSEAFIAKLQHRMPNTPVKLLPKAEWDGFVEHLAPALRPGDVVMSLGAGNVTHLLRSKPGLAALPPVRCTETVS